MVLLLHFLIENLTEEDIFVHLQIVLNLEQIFTYLKKFN